MPKPKFALIECDRPKGFSYRFIAFSRDSEQVQGFYAFTPESLGRTRWNATNGKLMDNMPQDAKSGVFGISLSNDGDKLMVVYSDRIGIYDTASLNTLGTVRVGGWPPVAWHPDGSRLVIGIRNQASCWSVSGPDKVAEVELKEHRECDDVTFAGFSSNGALALLGRNTGIEVWNCATGKVERPVVFSPKDGAFWQHGFRPTSR